MLAMSTILDSQLGGFTAALSLVFVVAAVLMPSGPFLRPHKIFWKVVSSILFVYTLLCTALLSLQVNVFFFLFQALNHGVWTCSIGMHTCWNE